MPQREAPEDAELLTSKRVAAILRVGPKTVTRYRADGVKADDGEQLYLDWADKTPGGHFLYEEHIVREYKKLTAERVTRDNSKRKKR